MCAQCLSHTLPLARLCLTQWDEGWAFYAGSLEGVDGSGSGKLLHALAEKRCGNFATCTDGVTGKALANVHALDAFKNGQACAAKKDASCMGHSLSQIAEQMTIPVLQGMLRYAYKADPATSVGVAIKHKEWVEGAAFARAFLPQLDACDPDVAAMVATNFDLTAATPMKDGYMAVLHAVETCYTSMGITCAEVGALDESSASAGDGKWQVCTDVQATLAGYVTMKDVSQHANIDKDLKEMEFQIDCQDGCAEVSVFRHQQPCGTHPTLIQ